MTTIKQRVQVAKDRALDELAEINDEHHGYWNLPSGEHKRVQQIGRLLSMADSSKKALAFADRLNFINGDEGLFFE